jgi:geranylgeranyl diphosphate synthase type I
MNSSMTSASSHSLPPGRHDRLDPQVVSGQECAGQRERVAAVQAALVTELTARWSQGGDGLSEMHRYALVPPGKLVRPLLVMWSALAVGGNLDQLLPVAVGFEAVHTGSLLHDDIIDGDFTRRGRLAVHAAFGPEQAMIAGNALFFECFAALGRAADRGVPDELVVAAMRIQAEAGVTACQGAVAELSLAGELETPVEDYVAVARAKTASLTRAACMVGALLGGGRSAEVHALAAFGEHYGLAFQFRDDLLPYLLPDEQLNAAGAAGTDKPADSDLRNHRPTLPVLLAYQRGSITQRGMLHQALLDSGDPGIRLARMRDLIHATGALTAARAMAAAHTHQALNALNLVPVSVFRTRLADLATPW